MGISVVIPARDAAATIGHQLDALSRQTFAGDWEVVVADNGSLDGTRAVAERHAGQLPRLRVIDASGRPGSAHARNQGVAAAEGTAIAFCDADDRVEPGWLAALVAALDEAPLVAGRYELESPDGTLWATSDCRHPYLGFLPYADSCSMAVDRAALESVGGFAEDMLRSSDVDLSWRMHLAGIEMVEAAGALVHKRAPASRWGRFHQAYRWARAEPALYVRYRTAGMCRSAWGGLLHDVGQILIAVPLLWRPATRERARPLAALRAGRLAGSLRARCWYP